MSPEICHFYQHLQKLGIYRKVLLAREEDLGGYLMEIYSLPLNKYVLCDNNCNNPASIMIYSKSHDGKKALDLFCDMHAGDNLIKLRDNKLFD